MHVSQPQQNEDLVREIAGLRQEHAAAMQYIRRKVNQLLTVMGTAPLRPEELDDHTLLELDPISIVSDSFAQVLGHLKETNEQLQIAHDEITAIFDSAGMGILVVDQGMRVITSNRKIGEHFGIDRASRTGIRCHELICGTAPDQDCPALKAVRTRASVRQEQDVNGRHFEVVATPIADKNGVISRVVLVYMDLTDRIRAQEEIRRSEERYRDLFENATDLIQILGADGSLRYVNRAWRERLGYRPEDLADLSIFDIVHPSCKECEPEFRNVVGGSTGGRFETLFITRGGGTIIVEGNVSPIMENGAFAGTRGIFRDITERRKLEERLARSEKIESLGVLAGGIAHDFNNLLNSIIANVDIGLKFSTPDSDVHLSLARAQKASVKAKELTQQLLTFSKGGAPVKKLSSIADLIRDTADFGTRGTTVRCEYLLPNDLWYAEIDEGQISQVIQNLVINAVQAMPGGGVIGISARNAVIRAKESAGLQDGNHVAITVHDQGQGIAPEHIGRIFEPYFTTKPGGSGLGLATTYSIMKKHEGAIEVESTPGLGTTFTLFLPASLQAPSPVIPPAALAPRSQSFGRVLIMDDDDLVRETAGVLLDLLGYEAAFAADGDRALEMYRTAKGSNAPYDVVIMDLTIPGGKGGKEAIRELLEIDPAAKAIVSSGYSNDDIMANYAQNGFAGVVVKPYTVDDLGAELQRVLGKK